MIAKLTGRIAELGPGSVVLDVGGVGYEMQIPLSTYFVLSGIDSETTSLHVHTHVREDALVLFGFATTEERSAFTNLIGISGVGPKIALAVLSGIEVGELRLAAAAGDRSRLERIPGIGRKTAERILLELRDRLEREDRGSRGMTRKSAPPGSASTSAPAAVRDDARSALLNLGYPRDRADDAVDQALGDLGPSSAIEDVLRAALRRLIR